MIPALLLSLTALLAAGWVSERRMRRAAEATAEERVAAYSAALDDAEEQLAILRCKAFMDRRRPSEIVAHLDRPNNPMYDGEAAYWLIRAVGGRIA